EHLHRERVGRRPVPGVQRLRRPGRSDDHRGADVLGLAQQHSPARPRDLRGPGRRRRRGHQRGPREPRKNQEVRPAVQADLHDRVEADVRVLVDVYRAKRDAMLRGLWEVLTDTDVEISRPQGGLFSWIKLPSATNVARLEALALEARVQYTPGRAFFAGKGGERHIRLAFTYEQPDKCYEGSRLLARAILDARRV